MFCYTVFYKHTHTHTDIPLKVAAISKQTNNIKLVRKKSQK